MSWTSISNFTYFLDADNGDQFEQFDERRAYGLHAELVRATNYGGLAGQLMFGVESRYEDIGRVGLYLTDARVRYDTIREDAVHPPGSRLLRRAAIAGHRMAARHRRPAP